MDPQQEPASSKPTPTRPVEELETVVIRFAGDSGDGMQLTGSEFTKASALAGNDLATLPDYPSEIRAPAGSLAGVSGYQLQFAAREVFTPGDQADVLVAMNVAALKTNLADLVTGGTLIVNSDAFTKSNLSKAGYEQNPLEDSSLDGYKLCPVSISRMTKEALKDSGLPSKSVERCKNFFALGLTFWLYGRALDGEVASIRQKFAKKPELADANIKVFKAGYHYGETAEIFGETYRVKAAPIAPGRYRTVTGNSATALGLVTACHLAELDLFFAGYPITPASDVLHALSRYRAYGVTTFQAEDEIAAMAAVVGGSFGGSMGVTATSGPGIALKGEAIGLGVTLELPMVIINVQRGGPSTGLPTKTEQSDLMQALYGRNGECPLPVIAARTPADCFDTAIEAVRVATKYMTPVLMLSDGYLANGSEPWRIPERDSLTPFPVEHRTDPEGYQVYQRDPDSLARAWVKPGTPGLRHRVGGLEKDALSGDVSQDALNHELMCRTRRDKVERIAQEASELLVNGAQSGELLLLSWGSTYGAVAKGVQQMRKKGYAVSQVHLRWLYPLHPELRALLERFSKVLVVEMNLGQMVKEIRSEYLVDAQPLSKIQGKPFKVSEICEAIEKHASVRTES